MIDSIRDYRASVNRQIAARNRYGALLVAIAADPSWYATPGGDYEIRGATAVARAFGMSPETLRRFTKGRRSGEAGESLTIHFTAAEIQAVRQAIEATASLRAESSRELYAIATAALCGLNK